jgi:predicted SAM-dependent methyltransferase
MFISAKRKITNKVADLLALQHTLRAALINILLEKHFPEVLAVVSTNYGNEAVDILAKTRFSKMIATVCHDHLHEVISRVSHSTAGTFRYVGDGKVRVIVGAASQRLPGWLATDIDTLNITLDSSWSNLFSPGSIDNILAEHVLEHLSLDELHSVLMHAKKYLKVGGVFRIAVPDAFHPSRYYYNLVKPGGLETPIEHKLFIDHEMLTRIADESGYQIRLLEYFDERGVFHKVDYSLEHGEIQRNASNNCGLDSDDKNVMEKFYATIPDHLRQQFYDQKITYTSLIVDFIS